MIDTIAIKRSVNVRLYLYVEKMYLSVNDTQTECQEDADLIESQQI